MKSCPQFLADTPITGKLILFLWCFGLETGQRGSWRRSVHFLAAATSLQDIYPDHRQPLFKYPR